MKYLGYADAESTFDISGEVHTAPHPGSRVGDLLGL